VTRRVLKWPLRLTADAQPIGAGVVALVATQDSVPTVWTVESEQTQALTRWVRIVGTGHPLDGDGEHIGSLTMGPYVWHLFADVTVAAVPEPREP